MATADPIPQGYIQIRGNVLDLRAFSQPRLPNLTNSRSNLEVSRLDLVRRTTLAKRLLSFGLQSVIYILIVFSLVWGMPRFLSWKLNTSFPIAAITSGSMWPELKRGDLVVMRGASLSEISKGDIVVWQNPSGFTIHRVARIDGDKVITKGDGNFKEDEPVKFSNIVGKALEFRGKPLHLPYLGYVSIIGAKIKANLN